MTINSKTIVPLRTKFTLYSTFLYQVDSSNSTALATGGQVTMNLNALSLPYPADATHQPYGFDQLAAFYRKYKVTSVDLELNIGTYLATSTPHSTIAWMQYRPPGSTATISGISNAWATLGDRTNCDYVHLQSSTAAGIKCYRRHIDIGKLAGLKPEEFDANVEDFTGLFSGTSPSKLCVLALATSSDTISAVTHNYHIRLAFNGEAFEREDFAQS